MPNRNTLYRRLVRELASRLLGIPLDVIGIIASYFVPSLTYRHLYDNRLGGSTHNFPCLTVGRNELFVIRDLLVDVMSVETGDLLRQFRLRDHTPVLTAQWVEQRGRSYLVAANEYYMVTFDAEYGTHIRSQRLDMTRPLLLINAAGDGMLSDQQHWYWMPQIATHHPSRFQFRAGCVPVWTLDDAGTVWSASGTDVTEWKRRPNHGLVLAQTWVTQHTVYCMAVTKEHVILGGYQVNIHTLHGKLVGSIQLDHPAVQVLWVEPLCILLVKELWRLVAFHLDLNE